MKNLKLQDTHKMQILQYAEREIVLCNSDSITIAIDVLRKENISTTTLEELQEAFKGKNPPEIRKWQELSLNFLKDLQQNIVNNNEPTKKQDSDERLKHEP